MNLAWVVLLLWGAFDLVLGPLHPPGDGDLFWQRWLGELILRSHTLPNALGPETFTSAGAAWIPQEWLFSVAVALAAQHNLFWLLSLAVSAAPLAILLLLYLASRDAASPESIGIALLLCGIALQESFGVRAQVLGWLMLAAFLYFLERRDRWYYAAFPTALLWANVHASVAIVPTIVFARLVGTFLQGGLRALRGSRDILMLSLTLLALFCTPLGWRMPLFAISLAHSPIRRFIQEWQPPTLHDQSFFFGALPLALLIIIAGTAFLRRELPRVLPAALLFAATLFASRNIPLFAITAAPLGALALDARFPQVRALGARVRDLAPAALIMAAVALVLSAGALLAIDRSQPPLLPTSAISSLAADRQDHRLLCEDFSWCSVALRYPNLRVFIDGRCDAYPMATWKRYIDAVLLRNNLGAALRADGVDAIVAQKRGSFAIDLAKVPGWRPSFEDRRFVVFRYE